MRFQNYGFCICCDQATRFVAENDWFRDHYVCSLCGCIPRERALMFCIDKFFPRWREAAIHESSPVNRGASSKLRQHARGYVASQFFPDVQPGDEYRGIRCESLETLTFNDATFDLHVTQDVMEHVFDPAAAFKEIARTLKPGGMHIFTVPLVSHEKPSEICAERRSDGSVDHLREPEYHGNPVSAGGALVTSRWGYDICDFIFRVSGLFTQIVFVDDLERGIRAEYIEVLITYKPASGAIGPGYRLSRSPIVEVSS